MKKTWSITTTLRNPERLRNFLIVLKEIEGEEWTFDAQKKFQILLIKHRVYGYGSPQFYQGLAAEQVNLIDDPSQEFSFTQAQEIFDAKGYEDPAMRGRQSINPLKKLGLAAVKQGKIFITDLGRLLLKDDYDLGEMFFRSFLKWQIPNPDNDDYKADDGCDIKPFIGTLHLIDEVNRRTLAQGEEAKGISKQEFSLFAPTLVNYRDIARYADEIMQLRSEMHGRNRQAQKEAWERCRRRIAHAFLQSDNEEDIEKLLNNLKDYGDNTIRYFRLTRYIYIRGGGFYVDLEPRRRVEIDNLLAFDNGASRSFATKEEYLSHIAAIAEPKLPWETREKLTEILAALVRDMRSYETRLSMPPKQIPAYDRYEENELKGLIESLRVYRRTLQEAENHAIAQDVEHIGQYIETLQNIRQKDDRALALEKYAALALHALDDALKIQPNYPVGDDNEPTFTAPAGKPDIECYYASFNAICEVTMLTSRDQWYNEGQPVMRHLRDFEARNRGKRAYCLFVAPSLHRDTLNTFWIAVKHEYEGSPQNIIPLSIRNFVELLQALIAVKQRGRSFLHAELLKLYDEILSLSANARDAHAWVEQIPAAIAAWQHRLTASSL